MNDEFKSIVCTQEFEQHAAEAKTKLQQSRERGAEARELIGKLTQQAPQLEEVYN